MTKSMPFWEHVYELRNKLLIILVSILFFSVTSYIVFPFYFKFFFNVINENLYATHIAEGFLTRLKVSILVGAFLTIPVFLFELLLFIFPALTKKEKIFFLITILSTFILFISGIVFAFIYVLPISINFLKSKIFYPENVRRLISYNTFVAFFFQFLIGFGLCFEFPIIILLMMKLKLIKLKQLIKYYKYVIIVCFIISAILTPPDIISQISLGVPMIILYTLTIIIGKILKIGV
jgi:sec-independent protein translocase protein TatC